MVICSRYSQIGKRPRIRECIGRGGVLGFDHTTLDLYRDTNPNYYDVPCGVLWAPSSGGWMTKAHTCEGLPQRRLALLAGVCHTGILGCPGARVFPAWRAGEDLGLASTVMRPKRPVDVCGSSHPDEETLLSLHTFIST